MSGRRRIGMAAHARVRSGGLRAVGRTAASTDRWAQIKEQVVARAGGCCQACGSRSRLDIHHVIKRSQGGSDFNVDLLVALCRRCHEQTDAPYLTGRLIITPLGAGAFQCHIARCIGQAAETEIRPTTLEAMRAVVREADNSRDAESASLPTWANAQRDSQFAHVGKLREYSQA